MVSLVFGPVPSRRLGRSLGINNIPYKVCTYSCVYCQLGKTTNKIVRRRRFYKPEDILTEVERKVEDLRLKGEHIDYLTFVPNGEPTLDINLGREISILKKIDIPTAVLTNASLFWNKSVRKSLLKADLVSLKVDAVSEELWRLVNMPHENLMLNKILEGVRKFAEEFNGAIISETMVIDEIEYNGEFVRIGRFLGELKNLSIAYIIMPMRPPAEKWVKPARREILNRAFQTFSRILGAIE
ncbi:MAG: radical SAM protein [Candidatus Bathyarchaeia archaeon]